MGDTVAHLTIEGLAGGDIGHRQAAIAGEFFGQTTFAGAGAAEDQLEHGFIHRIMG
ncbi:hypothetical protein D3C81_1981770 [compost metagenome]